MRAKTKNKISHFALLAKKTNMLSGLAILLALSTIMVQEGYTPSFLLLPWAKTDYEIAHTIDYGILRASLLARGLLVNTAYGSGALNVLHKIDLSYASFGFPNIYGDLSIAIDPRDSNVMYRTTDGAGVLKSTDGGVTWQFKNDGLPSLFTSAFAFNPTNPDIVYVGMNGHIKSNGGILYKSTNGGDYWSPVAGTIAGGSPFNINPCGGNDQIQIDPTNPNRIHLGVTINACAVYARNCGGPYHSSDGGATFDPNPACNNTDPWRQPNQYTINDAGILVMHPTRTNEIYIAPKAHPRYLSMITSYDYGTTLSFNDVVDTRASFLLSAEEGVASLQPIAFNLSPVNPDTRYAIHGTSPGDPDGALRRSDNIAIPRPYESGTISVPPVIVRYNGERSSSTTDGLDDNDLDSDPARDNIWRPIFSLSSIPLPASGNSSSTRYPQEMLASPSDENKVYLVTYTYGGSITNTEATLWEISQGQPGVEWSIRSIYKYTNTSSTKEQIIAIAFDPANPYRLFFTQRDGTTGGFGRPTKFIKLESADNGTTWMPQTLSTGYQYFHALDIREFETSSGNRSLFLGSTMGLYTKPRGGTTWTAKSAISYVPQGFSFTALTQSALNKDILYSKGPRYVAISSDGGSRFSPMDDIRFTLGEDFPSATSATSCGNSGWSEPVFTTTVINDIATHPSQSDTIYVAADNGVWKNAKAKSDGNFCFTPYSMEKVSKAWQRTGTAGLGNTYVWSVAFDPSDPGGDTLLAGTKQGIYKSSDGGSTWNTSLGAVRDVKNIAFSSNAILAASYDGLYRSTNGGVAWTKVVTGRINDLSARMDFPGHWAVATATGIMRSQDNGATWTSIPLAIAGNIDAVLYTTDPQTDRERVYYSGAGDILYTTDVVPAVTGPDMVAPAVSIITPSQSSTVSGDISLVALVSDNVGITKLEFKLDGIVTPIQELNSAPWSGVWDTKNTYNGIRTLTALAYDVAGNIGTSSLTFFISNPATFTAGLSGSVSKTVVQGSAVANVLTARLFGTGTPSLLTFIVSSPLPTGTTASFSPTGCIPNTQCTTTLTLTTSYLTPPGSYVVRAVGVSGTVGPATSFALSVTQAPPDTVSPSVSIASPGSGASVSGTVQITANASDDRVIAGVQFKLDGENLGAEDTSSAYAVNWDTTTVPNGNHTISAVARDLDGNITAASPVTVTVSNTISTTRPPAGGGGGGTAPVGTITPPVTPSLPGTITNPAVPQPQQPGTSNGSVGNTSLTQQQIDETIAKARARVTSINQNLVSRLIGKIVLQVQSKGEAWYVDANSRSRYYLPNGNEAYEALRKFGLGITDADIEKIPPGIETRFKETDTDGDGLPDKMEEGLGTNPLNADTDGDGHPDGAEAQSGYDPLSSSQLPVDQALVNRLKGRIVLQVQKKGQAWYINPVDGKRYYMTNGEAAYQIMRYLSLGITNSDLDGIGVGTLR